MTSKNDKMRGQKALLAYLGTYTKSASENGEENSENEDEVLSKYHYQAVARGLLPRERVALCNRLIVWGKQYVEVLRKPDGSSATYGQLVCCGSVWNCAVCAAKISEKRRVELAEATLRWGRENKLVMVTYTLAHGINDPLIDTLNILKDSKREMFSGRWWQEFKVNSDYAGSITASEVTWGKNGWHPHLHQLLFFRGKALDNYRLTSFQRNMGARWLEMLSKRGGSALVDVGLDVVTADKKIAAYIAKFGHEPTKPLWASSDELTRAAVKKSAIKGHVTPRGLLAAFASGQDYAGNLFREYARAFKGKRQLVWSKGLATLLGMEEVETDLALAHELEGGLEVFALLTQADWNVIMRNDNYGELRMRLLELARRGDFEVFALALAEYGVYLSENEDGII